MIFSCGLFAAEKLHVTFINPGKSDEAYWMMVTAFMKAAAEDLGITLEVLYVERNHFMQTQMARGIAARPNKPDYVVLVNEKLVAPETIKPLDDAGIKTFLIFNDLSDEQKLTHGIPRSKYKHWLGTMTPNNVDALRPRSAAWRHPSYWPFQAIGSRRHRPSARAVWTGRSWKPTWRSN